MIRTSVVWVSVICLSAAADLSALPLVGAFNFNGSVTVSQDNQTWKSDTAVANQATMGSTGLTGSFAGLGGTTITIQDLARSTEPVGSLFPAQVFIGFLAMPGPTLNINFIALGAFSPAQCHNPSTFPGQTCTLSSVDVPGGSPFMFTNTASNGVTVDGSSATWAMRGRTSDNLSDWTGIWTAQFNKSYQGVFADFATNGFVTNTYSASIVVTIPEPSQAILMGSGLLLVSLAFRKLRRT